MELILDILKSSVKGNFRGKKEVILEEKKKKSTSKILNNFPEIGGSFGNFCHGANRASN